MKKKAGRPKLPKNQAKTTVAAVKLSGEIQKAVDGAIKVSGQEKPDWMREALTDAVKNSPIWFKPDSDPAHYDGKRIQFQLTSPQHTVTGVGVLNVLENPFGECSMTIFVDYPISHAKRAFNKYFLSKDAVGLIIKNPDQNVAEYLLLA